MPHSERELVLVTIDASLFGGKEASVYGTPPGLRRLASNFRAAIKNKTNETCFLACSKGFFASAGINLTLHIVDDPYDVSRCSFRNTVRFRSAKKQYYKEDTIEYRTRRAGNCSTREDGGFVVAYPNVKTECALVLAGNAIGISHIADSFDAMADIVYGQYDPDWPENSEHYHSWIDGEDDVMLDCGLGLITGRLDHRKDGNVSWILDDLENNCDKLRKLFGGILENAG